MLVILSTTCSAVLAVDLVGGDVEPAVSGEDCQRCQEAHCLKIEAETAWRLEGQRHSATDQGLETQAELAALNWAKAGSH